jgi:hypothetical protein
MAVGGNVQQRAAANSMLLLLRISFAKEESRPGL